MAPDSQRVTSVLGSKIAVLVSSVFNRMEGSEGSTRDFATWVDFLVLIAQNAIRAGVPSHELELVRNSQFFENQNRLDDY